MAFARNPGRVLSRDQLSQAMAGHGEEPYGRSIDMHIGRLRRKIEPDPKAPRFIITVSGAGYKFAAGPQTVERNRKSPAAIQDERANGGRAGFATGSTAGVYQRKRALPASTCRIPDPSGGS